MKFQNEVMILRRVQKQKENTGYDTTVTAVSLVGSQTDSEVMQSPFVTESQFVRGRVGTFKTGTMIAFRCVVILRLCCVCVCVKKQYDCVYNETGGGKGGFVIV